MPARYRTNELQRATSLSTALQFDTPISSHRASGTEIRSHDTDQNLNQYLNALQNASQHRRAWIILFSSHHTSFTLRNVTMISTFRALAVPYLSENSAGYHAWDELGKLRIYNRGNRNDKKNVCICMLAGEPDRHSGGVGLSSAHCASTDARANRSRRTRRRARSRRPDSWSHSPGKRVLQGCEASV